jgi:hypothetical protein
VRLEQIDQIGGQQLARISIANPYLGRAADLVELSPCRLDTSCLHRRCIVNRSHVSRSWKSVVEYLYALLEPSRVPTVRVAVYVLHRVVT